MRFNLQCEKIFGVMFSRNLITNKTEKKKKK